LWEGAGMGNSFGGIKRAVEEEFERVRALGKDGRQYIVLDQVLQIENTKWESYPIDFNHLGTLFMLDKEKNGKFTIYVSPQPLCSSWMLS
jgi:hypothetical protein